MSITAYSNTSYNLSGLLDNIERGETRCRTSSARSYGTVPNRNLFDPCNFSALMFPPPGRKVHAESAEFRPRGPTPRIVDGAALTALSLKGWKSSGGLLPVAHQTPFGLAGRSRSGTHGGDLNSSRTFQFSGRRWPAWRCPSLHRATEEAKGPLDGEESLHIENAIQQLYDLRNYPFEVMELASTLDEEQAAEVFVRINSGGIALGQADFILTLMSVWWDAGRQELEDFSRAARLPAQGPSPANPFIDPAPDQLLRIIAGLAFRRARLRFVFAVLTGKDLQTGERSTERREAQFTALQEAQREALDLTNWHEFLKAVRRAGFRSGSMISSKNNLIFSYLIYLIGRRDHGIDRQELREVIARFFFMASMTSRYTGNVETQVEQDLRRIGETSSGEEFVGVLDSLIATSLTEDFWTTRLPDSLETSAAYGPTVFAYSASLVLLGARPLFSKLSMAELMDPSVHAPRSAAERHHLFPKAHLARKGIQGTRTVNQMANYAWVEWPDNLAIRDRAPSDYFPEFFERLTPAEQEKGVLACLPDR